MAEWIKIRIGELFLFEKGVLQSSKCTPGKYDFITAAEGWKTHNEYSHECEALIYAVAASGSLGRTHYINGKFISSDLCFIMTEKDKKRYPINFRFYQFILSIFRKDIVAKTKSGTSKEAINQKNFSNYLLPYIEIKQQNLWEEKMTAAQIELSSLEEEFSSQDSYFSLLRQSILKDAIEGKLTEVWRKKNPALKGDLETDVSVLLDQIKTEKHKLISEGKIRKGEPFEPVKLDEVPFELSEGWAWARLGEICDFITKGTTPATHELKDMGEIPYLKVYNIVNQKIDFLYKPQYISKEVHDKLQRSKVFPGDVLMNIVGPPLGKIALVPDSFPEWNINQALAIFRSIRIDINPYIYLFLNEGRAIKSIQTLGVVGQDNISLAQCRDIIISLPPLAEQRAIVDQVDRLLAMVDELEKQVFERKKQAEELMQTVLIEAFEWKE